MINDMRRQIIKYNVLLREDELEHWAKGETVRNHKYVKREKTKDGWKYFYPDDLKKKISGAIESTKKKIGSYVIYNRKTKQYEHYNNYEDYEKRMNEIREEGKRTVKNTLKYAAKTLSFGVPGLVSALKDKKKDDNQKKADEENKKADEEKKKADEEKKKETPTNVILDNKEPDKYKYIARIKLSNGKWKYFYSQEELKNYYEKNGTKVEKELMDKYGLKEKDASPDEDSAEINERYHEGVEYQMNCYSCSLNYDLRRRGYNTEAIADYDGATADEITACYKDPVVYANQTPMSTKQATKEMVDTMKREGDGAYGNLFVYWKSGGGHSMVWAVENNEVVIRDCQTNTVYKGNEIETLISYTYVDRYATAMNFFRTDNLELTDEILKYTRQN